MSFASSLPGGSGPDLDATERAALQARLLTGTRAQLARALGDEDLRRPLHLWDIFVGAVFSLGDGRPDHLARAAHGIRELLDKLPLANAEAPVRRVGDVASAMRSVAEEVLRAKETSICFDQSGHTWHGNIDGPLISLLRAVDAATSTVAAFPTRRDLQLAFIRSRDVAGAGPVPGEDGRLREWGRLYAFFTSVSHHDRTTTDIEFADHLDRCVDVLLTMLRPRTSETLQTLDDIIAEGE